MKETKIQFSQPEMELMHNAEIILTKNKVVEKVKCLLEELQSELVTYSRARFLNVFPNPFLITPKISRGENYLGLPYLVLDYPRNFGMEENFAIRTMFWWGKFFSTTLYLSGSYKKAYAAKLEPLYPVLSEKNFYLGVNPDPWVHHFEADNYAPVKETGPEVFSQQLKNLAHLKIASKTSLQDAPGVLKNLLENWKLLANSCLD